MQEVLHNLDSFFNVQLIWLDLTISGNLISWFSKDGDLLHLPIVVIWNLWKTRNNYIFENIEPNIFKLCHRVMLEVTTHQVPHIKRTKVRNIGPPPKELFPMAFFDGAATDSTGGFLSLD